MAGITNSTEGAARYVEQAGYDPLQQAALAAGFAQTGVVSGCAVTAQGSPDTTVAVASGTVVLAGATASVASGNVSGFTAPAAGLRRIDLVVANASGTKSRLAGAAATPADLTHPGPVWPAAFDSTTYVVLAEVTLDAADSTVVAGCVVDKRVLTSAPYAPLGGMGTATQAGTAAAPTATRIWQFSPPADDTFHGPIAITVGGSLFQSTFDRVTYIGPNAGDGGGTIVGTDSTIHLTFEQDYDDSAKRVFECYFEYTRASAVSLTDGVTTNGSPTVTSAATTFTSTRHVGQAISGAGIPANTYIGVVNSAHSIGLSSTTSPNTPVNATATATGVTLSIVPSGPTGHRFLFAQVNKATGDLHLELNATGGFSFNTTDGNQTAWGGLSPGGLSITGLSTSTTDTSLTLSATATGKKTYIQMGGPVGNANSGLILQNYQGNVWSFQIGPTTGVKFTTNAMLVGDATQSFAACFTAIPATADKDSSNCFFAGVRSSQSTSAFVVRDVDSGLYKMSIEANGDVRVLNSSGIHIGTATSQKLGIWAANPIVQPTTAVAAATFVANTSGIANDTATFDGYTIGQVVKALRNFGALA